jgi:hypothetical protein
MRKFQPFPPVHAKFDETVYKTQMIGDDLDNPEKISRSTFKSVSDFVYVIDFFKFKANQT